MTADFSLIAHTAERHADIFTSCGLGDGFGERGLADAGRSDEAQDRTLELLLTALDGQILDNTLLDLLKTEMIGVEHVLGEFEIVLDLARFLPRNGEQPVKIVADHRGLGRHGRHGLELLQLGLGLFARFLGELGLADALFQFGSLVAAVLALAELLLNGLHLLIQIVLALSLLHLTLDARTDTLFHLQHGNLGFHEAHGLFKPLANGERGQHFLLLGNLDRQM